MTFIEFFKKQFIEEAATTRKMLSRVPDNQYNFKPHEKSMVMKSLVSHLADLPGWIHFTLTQMSWIFKKHTNNRILLITKSCWLILKKDTMMDFRLSFQKMKRC